MGIAVAVASWQLSDSNMASSSSSSSRGGGHAPTIAGDVRMAPWWTAPQDRVLRRLYAQGIPVRAIAEQVGRSPDAVSDLLQ